LRKLHLVGLTTDRDGLIFTARQGSKSGGFIVPLDDAVLTAVAQAQAERNGAGADAGADIAIAEVEAVPRRPRHQSALTPREMQARLRAGRSIDEVAAEAGVDSDWVARFAVPILAEQAQVVELARGLVYAKPRLGESSEPLGPSVMQNLSDRGVFLPDDIADAGWSAFQLHDSVWMVRFRYRSRGRNQEAQWEVDVPAGRLQARNRHASDLGYVDPVRRRRVVVDEDAVDDDINPAPGSRRPAPAAAPSARSRAAGANGRLTSRSAASKVAPSRRATKKVSVSKASGPRATSKAMAGTAGKATASKAARPASKATASKVAASKVAAAKVAAANSTAANSTAGRARAASKATTSKAAGARTPAARATAVRRTAARATAANGGTARAAAKAPRPVKTSRPAKAIRPVKGNGRTTARVASTPAPAKVGTDGGPAKAVATRRPAKAAGTNADAGPSGHTGGVRSAVAQIATARVTASMAAADRAPWAGVVAPRSISRLSLANGNQPGPRRSAPAPPVADRAEPPAFEPRPLPKGGDPSVAGRVRKLPSPPVRPEGVAPVSLPARRVPSPRTEPIPVERPKRRRLRSR
jgi:hypothetical protein